MTKSKSREAEIGKYLGMIRSFRKCRVLVIGDIMLDEYVWGAATRISPEAPVPVVEVKSRTFHAGGAANTVSNIMSLGASAALMGVLGLDANGRLLKRILDKDGIDTRNIIRDHARPTTSKVRIIAQGQQVMRADQEETFPIGDRLTDQMLKQAGKMIGEIDGFAISDYNKGVIGPRLTGGLINLARETGKPIVADVKPGNMELFKGVTVVKPNRIEASQMSGISIRDEGSLQEAGHRIRRLLGTAAVIITLGEGGIAIFTEKPGMERIPAVSTQVYDVTGAGDTVLATVAVGLSAGHSIMDSARLANYAAGVVVRKRGTASAHADELAEFIRREMS